MGQILEIVVPGMYRSGSPYSPAIRVGSTVFVSGCVPIDRMTGALVEGDIRVQTAAVLSNIEAILAAAGADLRRVVKTTVFLTDFGDFAGMNEVYRSVFREPFPARSTVEVRALAHPAFRVEIEAIAVLDKAEIR